MVRTRGHRYCPSPWLTRLPEITQTSKIRKKDEFLRAYDPIIAESTAAAYKGSPPEIQNKIRRVVEVWRQRQIFQPSIQTQIEQAIDGRLLRRAHWN